MRIRLTWTVSDVERRAIRWRAGESGLATRKEVIDAYNSLLDGDVEVIVSEMDDRAPQERRRIESKANRAAIRAIDEEMRQNGEVP